MTAPNTSPEVIAALLDGVTPGPWRTMTRYSFVLTKDTTQVVWEVPNSTGLSLVADPGKDTHSARCDARFIAAARELVPALTAERDAAQAEVARMRAALRSIVDLGGTCGSEKYAGAADYIARAALGETP